MQGVATILDEHVPAQRGPQQPDIPHRVHQFVDHRLVRHAKGRGMPFVEQKGVVSGGPLPSAHRPQPPHFLHTH